MKKLLLAVCVFLMALCTTQTSAAQTLCCAGAGYPTGMTGNPCAETTSMPISNFAPAFVNAALPLWADQAQIGSAEVTRLKNGNINVIYGFKISDLRRQCHIDDLAGVQFQLRFRSRSPVLGAFAVQVVTKKKGARTVVLCKKCVLNPAKSGDYIFQLDKDGASKLAPYYQDGSNLRLIATDASSPIMVKIVPGKDYPTMTQSRRSPGSAPIWNALETFSALFFATRVKDALASSPSAWIQLAISH